jgi:hypothetical protein
MESACNHLQLLVPRQLAEVHSVCKAGAAAAAGGDSKATDASALDIKAAAANEHSSAGCMQVRTPQAGWLHRSNCIEGTSVHDKSSSATTKGSTRQLTSTDADGQVGVLLRVLHSIHQHLPVHRKAAAAAAASTGSAAPSETLHSQRHKAEADYRSSGASCMQSRKHKLVQLTE